MKNKFLIISFIVFLIYVCFTGCQQPTSSSGSHSNSDSDSNSGPKVISNWTGTAYSITNDTYSDFTLTLYDNNTFKGSSINPGISKSSITGSYSLTVDTFNGNGSGTTIVYIDGIGSDNFSVTFIGTIDLDTMEGGFELDYNNWPDEIGTFELTKE